MAKHLRRRAPALQKPRDLGLRRHDAAFLSRLAFALHGRQARALLVPDQVRADKAVRAPVSPFLESALKWRPSEAGASGHPPPRLGTGAAERRSPDRQGLALPARTGPNWSSALHWWNPDAA